MTGRVRLPNRRAGSSFDLEFAGLHYNVTVGRFPDGRPAEIFLANHKAGNAADVSEGATEKMTSGRQRSDVIRTGQKLVRANEM